MNQAMKLQGDAQKAALLKIGDQLGVESKNVEALQTRIDSINNQVIDVQSWISSGGSGVITAYPNWANPTELRAQSADGGYLKFNGNGLGYTGPDGILRSAIDSQGRVVAESISGGTITGVTIKGAQITADTMINIHERYYTVLSGSYGFSVSDGLGNESSITIDRIKVGGTTINGSQLYQVMKKCGVL